MGEGGLHVGEKVVAGSYFDGPLSLTGPKLISGRRGSNPHLTSRGSSTIELLPGEPASDPACPIGRSSAFKTGGALKDEPEWELRPGRTGPVYANPSDGSLALSPDPNVVGVLPSPEPDSNRRPLPYRGSALTD